jgi:hypothetical protein
MTAPIEHEPQCPCVPCDDARWIAEDTRLSRTADAGGWG